MTSQPGKQTIAIQILANISKSKGNQTMKCGKLINCNMMNIFLGTSYTKCDAEAITRPFSKKSKLRISLDQQAELLFSLFYFQVHEYQNILELRCWPLAFIFHKGFLSLKASLRASFFASFLKKKNSIVIVFPCYGYFYFVRYWATTTLVQKTLLFLQNTKIIVSEVPLLNYSHTQCVIQNKAM